MFKCKYSRIYDKKIPKNVVEFENVVVLGSICRLFKA